MLPKSVAIFGVLISVWCLLVVTRAALAGAKNYWKEGRSLSKNENVLNSIGSEVIRVPLVYWDHTHNFHTEFSIGTPGQKFRAVLDTSRSFSWIPWSLCRPNDEWCDNHRRYHGRNSLTYQKDGRPVRIYYGYTVVIGRLASDVFNIGALQLKNFTFVEEVTVERLSLDSYDKYDGFLGMGLEKMQPFNLPGLFQSATQRGLIPEPIFSVYMKPDSKDGGELILGAIDSKYIGQDVLYAPLVRHDYWHIKVDEIYLRQTGNSSMGSAQQAKFSACQGGCKALVDTNRPRISGPPEEVGELNKRLGAGLTSSGYVIENCDLDKLPNLVVKIGGIEFDVEPKNYLLQWPQAECLSLIETFDHFIIDAEMYWVLGSSFLANRYTIFDQGNKRIGFAKSGKSNSSAI